MSHDSRQHAYNGELHAFEGGLSLATRKSMSTGTPIKAAPVCDRYVLPLQQHIGTISEPLVRPGERVRKGQKIARPGDVVSAAIHAPVSGTVVAIEQHDVAHPSGLPDTCIVIENDHRDDWVERTPLADDYNHTSSHDLRRLLRDKGIVGLGGATFPTDVKETETHIETLILNGVECEPYITCDDMLMREKAGQILAGADIIGHIIKARHCVVAIEDNKPEAIDAMQQAIDADGTGFFELAVVPTRYPSGGERQLIKIITGREVPQGRLPAEVDAMCHNVGTAFAVWQAIYEDRPLISRIMTVTGAGIGQPANLDVLIGTPMHRCVEACGGYRTTQGELIVGGPMMGFSLKHDHQPVVKASNCLLVLADEERQPASSRAAHLPCIRCGHCVDVCPARLLPQQLYWYASSRNLERAEAHHLFDCIECGCCAYVCPSDIPLVQYYRFAKMTIRQQEAERRASDIARQRHEAHQRREERQKREREARLRKKRELLKKKNAGQETGKDSKQSVIEAAVARARARKAALEKNETGPESPH